jgi:hypothetical protein
MRIWMRFAEDGVGRWVGLDLCMYGGFDYLHVYSEYIIINYAF